MAEDTNTQNTPFSEEEIREGKRLLLLLRQLEAAGGQTAAAAPAPHRSVAGSAGRWLGMGVKIALVFVLLLAGLVVGSSSGVFGTEAKKAFQEQVSAKAATPAPPATAFTLPDNLENMSDGEIRSLLDQEVARQKETAGLGEEGRDLVAKLKESIENDNRAAEATQKAYENALKQLADARDAARKRGAMGVDVEAAVKEVLDRIGIAAEPQDISCLTDPNWDPAKAAAEMVAEQNARRKAQSEAAAASAAAAATQPVTTKQ